MLYGFCSKFHTLSSSARYLLIGCDLTNLQRVQRWKRFWDTVYNMLFIKILICLICSTRQMAARTDQIYVFLCCKFTDGSTGVTQGLWPPNIRQNFWFYKKIDFRTNWLTHQVVMTQKGSELQEGLALNSLTTGSGSRPRGAGGSTQTPVISLRSALTTWPLNSCPLSAGDYQ